MLSCLSFSLSAAKKNSKLRENDYAADGGKRESEVPVTGVEPRPNKVTGQGDRFNFRKGKESLMISYSASFGLISGHN